METVTYQEVQGLSRMTVGELRDKYIEVFGEETRSCHKESLRKRIARRIQALAEGDLSEQARRGAEEPTNDADLRTRSPRDPVASGSAEVKARTATGPISPSRPKAASARNSARPRVPRPRHRGQGPRQRLRVRRPMVQVPLSHRPGGHREQVERVPLLRHRRWRGQRREPQIREEERKKRGAHQISRTTAGPSARCYDASALEPGQRPGLCIFS